MQAFGTVLGNSPDLAQGFALSEAALDAPAHPAARQLLAHWRGRVGDGGFIVGRDLPARPVAKLLANLALFEYCQRSDDFRARLAGFSFTRRFGRDIASHLLAELFPRDEHLRQHAAMRGVLETGEPRSFDIWIRSRHAPPLHLETLLLKVLAADRVTPLVLLGLFYFERHHRAG